MSENYVLKYKLHVTIAKSAKDHNWWQMIITYEQIISG